MKIGAVQKHIEVLYKAGARHTLLLLGPPGIGKSDSGKGASKSLNVNFRQWQATIEDPLELPGLPAVQNGKAVRLPFEDRIPGECDCKVNKGSKCTKCQEDKCWECEGVPRCQGAGILIIDEINSAPPLTQASLYSLVWDRKLGGSHLGKNWMIVATGNRAEDRAVTQRMPTPLVSRMEHINVEPDHDGWIVLMAVEGGHESVRAFVKSRMDLFVTFKADLPGPFACPRTWKMVSDVMLAYGRADPPFESIAGWVGDGPATEFMAYHKMALDLPDPDEIIKNPEKIRVPKDDPGAMYALTTALAGRANFVNFNAIITYLNRCPVEFAVYCVSLSRDVERGRMAKLSEDEKKKFRRIRDNKAFSDWALKHYELIVDN